MVRMAGIEPAVCGLTRLEPSFLIDRPAPSPDWHSGKSKFRIDTRPPRWNWSIGATALSRAGVEPLSPTALSRRRVYQFRHEREFVLEDLVGFEPTVTFVDGLKSAPLAAGGTGP